ncbi:hypothetical protein KA089_00290, partial [Candidatus Woesebacteria bacterium]|nr:hypothetical protein [Candidatus Woesebacteria bacterium]
MTPNYLKFKSSISKKKNVLGLLILILFLFISVTQIQKIQSNLSRAAISSGQTIEGTLNIAISDDFVNKNSKIEHYVNYTENNIKKSVKIDYKGNESIKPGSTVRVTTQYPIKTLNTAGTPEEISNIQVVSTKSAGVVANSIQTGTKKVAVILLNWSDLATTTPSRTQVLDLFNGAGKIHDIYAENSFNLLNINVTDADIYGWYNMPISSTMNGQGSCQNFSQVADISWMTDNAVENWVYANVPVNLANYQHVMYVLPTSPGCIGGIANVGYEGYGLLTSVINAANFDLKTVPHELGHNLGAGGHANTLNCSTNIPA